MELKRPHWMKDSMEPGYAEWSEKLTQMVQKKLQIDTRGDSQGVVEAQDEAVHQAWISGKSASVAYRQIFKKMEPAQSPGLAP